MKVLHDRIHSRGLIGPGPEDLIWLFALPFSMADAPVPFLVQLPSVSLPYLSTYQSRRPLKGAGPDGQDSSAGAATWVGQRQARFQASMQRGQSQQMHVLQQLVSPFAQRSAPASPSSPAAGHRLSAIGATPAHGGTHLHPGQRTLEYLEQAPQQQHVQLRSFERTRPCRGDNAEPTHTGSMQGSGGGEREMHQQQQLPGSFRPLRSAQHHRPRHASDTADEAWASGGGKSLHFDINAAQPFLATLQQQEASLRHGTSRQDSATFGGAAHGPEHGAFVSPASSAQPPLPAHAPGGSGRQTRGTPQHSSQAWDMPAAPSHAQRQGYSLFERSTPALQQRQHVQQHMQQHPQRMQPQQQQQQQQHHQQQDYPTASISGPPPSHLFSAVRRLNMAGPSGAQSWSPTPHGSPGGALDMPDPLLVPLHTALRSQLAHAGSAPEELPALQQLGTLSFPAAAEQQQRMPQRRRSSLRGGGYRLSALVPTSDRSHPEVSPKQGGKPVPGFRGVCNAQQAERQQQQLSPEASPAGHRRASSSYAAQRKQEAGDAHAEQTLGFRSPGEGQDMPLDQGEACTAQARKSSESHASSGSRDDGTKSRGSAAHDASKDRQSSQESVQLRQQASGEPPAIPEEEREEEDQGEGDPPPQDDIGQGSIEAALQNCLVFKSAFSSSAKIPAVRVLEHDVSLEHTPGKGPPPVKTPFTASHPGAPMQLLVPFETAEPDQASPFLNTPAQHPGQKGLRLEVGSGLQVGEWTSSAGWQEILEWPMHVPPCLQQISSNALVKVRELGRGQCGRVWQAHWRGVDVALKELHAPRSAHSAAGMLAEAATLARLRHPCVIAFYGVVVDQGSPASVMEYVPGGSLRAGLQWLAAQGSVPERLRVAAALQAARGMEYLHSRCVVHFDLKCDNLLADLRDGGAPAVKIGDMGLSKQKAATFLSGNMRGTLPWMAPELFPIVASSSRPGGQRRSDDQVTERVDVFSFGICLWEIWTLGQQVYPDLPLPAIFTGIISGTLRPILPPDAPQAWRELMDACCALHPAQRPSFTEVAAALEHLLRSYDHAPDAQATSGLGRGSHR